MFDAHMHLVTQEEIQRAIAGKVNRFICNATSMADWENVLLFSEQNEGVYPCIGFHPWFIDKIESSSFQKMEEILKNNPSVMIGEIGLDATKENMPKQEEVFEKCLVMASLYKRAVHIHGYKSWDKIAHILKKYPNLRCLFHRYTGSLEQTEKLLQVCDAYFSVLSTKAIPYIPADKLLVESDSPDGLHTPENVMIFVQKSQLDEAQLEHNFNAFLAPL